MRKFLLYLGLFLSPLIPFLIYTFIYYSYKLKEVNLEFDNISMSKHIILGDSQMQRLKSSTIGKDVYNFASSGEHYYFTYLKLKKLVESKKCELETVILGASYHSFSPVFNRLIDVETDDGKRSLERYLYFLDYGNNDFLRTKNLFSKIFIVSVFKKPDFGGNVISKNSAPNLKTINKNFTEHYDLNKNSNKNKLLQVKYLKLINKICLDQGIKIYLISTLYHHEYIIQVDKLYLDFFNKTICELENITYISYLDLPFDKEYLSDGNHLSSLGGDVISKMIKEEIFTEVKKN